MLRFGKTIFQRIVIAAITIVLLSFVFADAYSTKQTLVGNYLLGNQKLDEGDYDGAINIFQTIGDYRDSFWYIEEAKEWAEIQKLKDAEDYKSALERISTLKSRMPMGAETETRVIRSEKEVQDLLNKQEVYLSAKELYDGGDYAAAQEAFLKLGGYKDSPQLTSKCEIMLRRLAKANSISAGIRHSAAVTSAGQVLFCGDSFAEKEDLLSWRDIISVFVKGEFAAGLKQDGTLLIAQNRPGRRLVTNHWENIVDVAMGQQYIVGLKEDGTLVAQGIDGFGETNVDGWSDIIAVDASWQRTVGLDRDGQVHITGVNSEKFLAEIDANREQWTDLVDVATGGSTGKGNRGGGHVVALRRDGTVVAAGDNHDGQCDVGEWKDVVAISAGDYHTVGLTSDGRVLTTQSAQRFPNSYKETSSWRDIVAISAGYGYTLGLKRDGTVVATGNDQQGQCDVYGWENVALRTEEQKTVFDFMD